MGQRTFFLFANPGKPESLGTVGAAARMVAEQGCRVLMDGWLHGRLGIGEPMGIADMPAEASAVIALGGDGTLLRALPAAAQKRVPVLGINVGHTGFLLEAAPDNLEDAIGRLLRGEYHVEERMMLRCQINGGRIELVMNEIALTRGQNPSSIVADVHADGERVFTIHGDGVLVSTPTGTTGYALSAGGPVVHPGVDCMTVVPISSHVMHHRPMVLPPQARIRLRVLNNRGSLHQVSMDGQIVMDLTTDTAIDVIRAPQTARFIRFGEERFLTRLTQKQTEWSNNRFGGGS
ncbi:MAG TPA: NAD(+)/NADH kinase [Candidatus Limnocylindria bacterium]|nr:NAD(+)/NADH kinase [Candidatus Limnocylindria bacterium]